MVLSFLGMAIIGTPHSVAENFGMPLGNWIRTLAMKRYSTRFQINVKLAMRIATLLPIEQLFVLGKDFVKFVALLLSQMSLCHGNFAKIRHRRLGGSNQNILGFHHIDGCWADFQQASQSGTVLEVVAAMEWNLIVKPLAGHGRAQNANLHLVKEGSSEDNIILNIGSIENLGLDSFHRTGGTEFGKLDIV